MTPSATTSKSPLPPVPHTLVDAQGQPRLGRYRGALAHMDWAGLQGSWARSAWWRHFHHKRWHYVGLGNAHCFVGMALVDLGWTNTAFVYLFDRRTRQLKAQCSRNGVPGLTAHISHSAVAGSSGFRSPGVDLRIDAVTPGQWRLHARVGGALQLEAVVFQSPGQEFMTAVGPIAEGGCVHSTAKSCGLRVQGHALALGQRYALDDAVAAFDYSNGLLARHTAWAWACAHSPTLGFNLQQGYFGDCENTLWLDGQPHPLGAAHFEFDATRPLQPWRVCTDDGLLDLHFEPEGARQQSQNLLLAASEYIQPVGTFHGSVRAHAKAPEVPVRALLGVTEDHRSTW